MEASDGAVLIPGRNLLLLTMASLWCVTHSCHFIGIGIFGTPEIYNQKETFFHDFESLLPAALNTKITILTELRGVSKAALIRQYSSLPLHLTLSCIKPINGIHCGKCNKCEERRFAIAQAQIDDLTEYFQ